MSEPELNQSLIKACANAAEHGASSFTATSNGSSNYFTAKANSSRVKTAYDRGDYETYREHEAIPRTYRDLMRFGDDAYKRVGIVYNIVNLMCDFVTKGISWQHENRAVESFYNSWFNQVDGSHVSERYCSHLIRLGNTVIYPTEAKIKESVVREWKKTKGNEFGRISVKNRYIPTSYNFINPLSVSQMTGEFGSFVNSRVWVITLPTGISGAFSERHGINHPRITQKFQNMVNAIPEALRKKIKKEGDSALIFNDDELIVDHYRKDDWDLWAQPMIAPIFPQLVTLEKMHLADMSALDGAISNVRLWRVGYIDPSNINNSIIPTPEMLQKARDLVHNNISGGVLDVVWGPEIDFKESSTQVHQFLGPEKYTQVMLEIYDGLGVPPSLTGGGKSGSGGGGFTNNFVSMKVLIERLNYLRGKIAKFWNKEAKKIQKAMGFTHPARLKFEDAILSDEENHKKLLLDMWDRDMVDTETIQEDFNMYPDIIKSRLGKEYKKRQTFKVPPKAGPYHDPNTIQKFELDMIKEGRVDSNESVPFDVKEPEKEDKFKPNNQDGRPFGARDQTKRKQKVVTPRTAASDFIHLQNWAKQAYDQLSDVVNPIFLSNKAKGSIRELTRGECDKLEDFKLTLLGNYKPFSKITEDNIIKTCASLNNKNDLIEIRNDLLEKAEERYSRKMTIEDKRLASYASYALFHSAFE